MQHATSISAEEQRIAAMRSGAGMHGEGRSVKAQLYYYCICIIRLSMKANALFLLASLVVASGEDN